MSAHRFFLASALGVAEPGDTVPIPLSAEDLHHALSVARLREGETAEFVEPDGRVWVARVASAARAGVTAELVSVTGASDAAGPSVTLVAGVAKGEKMDAIVRQAVEVGAAGIVPVLTERTVVRLEGRKRAERAERWRRIAKSAAEQSHRFEVPSVAEPLPLAEATKSLMAAGEVDRTVVLWEEERERGLSEALDGLPTTARVALVVGPEGGFSAEEVASLVASGAVTAGLGDTILRAETAAVVGLGLAIHALGGLSPQAR